MTVAFSLYREKPLGIHIDEANKRANSIHKRLEGPVQELSILIAEGRSMAFGTEFTNGTELAMFLSNAVISEIAFLMEKGVIAKRLPKAKEEADGEKGGGYL